VASFDILPHNEPAVPINFRLVGQRNLRVNLSYKKSRHLSGAETFFELHKIGSADIADESVAHKFSGSPAFSTTIEIFPRVRESS